jgi:hypothetical protein
MREKSRTLGLGRELRISIKNKKKHLFDWIRWSRIQLEIQLGNKGEPPAIYIKPSRMYKHRWRLKKCRNNRREIQKRWQFNSNCRNLPVAVCLFSCSVISLRKR